jgi:hypothetical protein
VNPRLHFVIPVCLAVSLFLQGCTIAPGARRAVAGELEITEVQHLPAYVIGFPMFASMTVRSGNLSFNHLPFANILALNDCIGIEFLDSSNRSVAHYVPQPIINPESGAFGEQLGAGQSRRMLFDFSPLVPAAIAEGEYTVRFSYASTRAVFPAGPFHVRFRMPSQAESAWISSFAPTRLNYANWADWTVSKPKSPLPTTDINFDNPLKFDLVLRRLFFGSEPLTQVDLHLFDLLNGMYDPESKALKSELYFLRGEKLAYQQIKAELLRDTPGLAWWLEMVEGGGAFLKTYRLDLARNRS